MTSVKPIPDGFTAVTPHLHVKGAAEAIDFYAKAFDAAEVARSPVPGDPGKLMHAQIRIFGAPVLLVDYDEQWGNKDPLSLGGTSVAIHLYVEDCDAVHARAVEAGCESVMEPNDAFWGDRFAAVKDPFGHQWTIATHVKDLTAEEIKEGGEAFFDE